MGDGLLVTPETTEALGVSSSCHHRSHNSRERTCFEGYKRSYLAQSRPSATSPTGLATNVPSASQLTAKVAVQSLRHTAAYRHINLGITAPRAASRGRRPVVSGVVPDCRRVR